MIFKIIISIIIVLLILLFVLPIRIKVLFGAQKASLFSKITRTNEGYIKVYIFGFVRIINKNVKKTGQDDIEKNVKQAEKIQKRGFKVLHIKELISKLYLEKLDLKLGFNLNNPIANAYMIALLNALINMYFGMNSKKINLENINYSTEITDSLLNIDIESIIKFNLANTISIIIKIISSFRKVENKNGRKRTSNRKFNDDSNDISREYGRC